MEVQKWVPPQIVVTFQIWPFSTSMIMGERTWQSSRRFQHGQKIDTCHDGHHFWGQEDSDEASTPGAGVAMIGEAIEAFDC